MNLFQLILRNIWQRRLASVLTSFNVALGVMLVCTILLARHEIEQRYMKQGQGFSLVVGPTGSPLELVLNSIYHLGQSQGLMPFSAFEELKAQPRHVRLALPYAVGDSYRGYRVVATDEGLFSKYFPQPPGEGQEKLSSGRPFVVDPVSLKDVLEVIKKGQSYEEHLKESGHDDDDHDEDDKDDHDADDHDHGEGVNEAILGAAVAAELKLQLGAHIQPSHGIEGASDHAHDDDWTVVGILKPTGTPIDKVVFINLDSFYRIAEHAGGRIPSTGEPGLSSVLLFPRPGVAKPILLSNLKKRSDVQVAEVATEIRSLMDLIGRVDEVFWVISLLVVIIGIVSIMVAIYNTMNERRRELAIMRALGARRTSLVFCILGESFVLTLIGALVGLAMTHIGLHLAADTLAEISGIDFRNSGLLNEELYLVVLVSVAGALAGLIPAWKAYRSDVAQNLSALS